MTDLSAAARRIVERLRAECGASHGGEHHVPCIYTEAADEIERLRELEKAARGIGNAGVNVHVLPDLLVQLNQAIAALDHHRSKKP